MSSDFNFTVASWFLGNVHVKPISTHSALGVQKSKHSNIQLPLLLSKSKLLPVRLLLIISSSFNKLFVLKSSILDGISRAISTGWKRGKFIYLYFLNTIFHNIVSSLDYFPSLNSFCTLVRKLFQFSLHKRKTNAETIWIFKVLQFQKRIVAVATIWGTTVVMWFRFCSL